MSPVRRSLVDEILPEDLEDFNVLRDPNTPKPGDIVKFRPYREALDDPSYWERWAWPGSSFRSLSEPHRYLVGKIQAIKPGQSPQTGWYYRISSGMTAYAVPFRNVLGKGDR